MFRFSKKNNSDNNLKLVSGSKVAVIGGGPAGSFFSYFLLNMIQKINLDIKIDIYEPKDFSLVGPSGCNMCAGVVSELLIQQLSLEGINLPSTIVQRGIDSYVIHMDDGSVRIETPFHEKRIATVSRRGGPRGKNEVKCHSFDGYLLDLAVSKGAYLVKERVDSIGCKNGRPEIKNYKGLSKKYDLLSHKYMNFIRLILL